MGFSAKNGRSLLLGLLGCTKCLEPTRAVRVLDGPSGIEFLCAAFQSRQQFVPSINHVLPGVSVPI